MSAHTLITEHLDLWTQAVTQKSTAGRGRNGKIELTGIKKLRELILELAVRGKLVEQVSADGHSSVLLKEVADEKKRLIETGVLKRKKNSGTQHGGGLFDVPPSWSWITTNEICAQITDGEHNTPERTADTSAIPLATAKNVRDGYIDLAKTDFVPPSVAETCWNRCKPEVGDILMVSVGATLGRLALVYTPQAMVLVRSVTLLRPIKVVGEYLAIYLRAPTTQSWIWRNVRQSAQPCLYLSKSSSIPVCVPPLLEQHRIVQKVDELMALCDRLEQQTSNQLDAHETLVDTLLGTLIQSENATELADNWARLAEHFDTLFATEQSIDKLKQTILQLAVMGRLVEQDEREEKACILLESILHKKKELVHNKVFQKTSKLKETRVQFNLPEGWVATKMGEVCPSIVPSRDKPKTFTGSIPWVTLPAFPDSSWYLDTAKIEAGLSEKEVSTYSARIIPPGSVMMSCVGRFGLTAINRTAVVANQQVHAFIPLKDVSPEFLSMVIKVAATSLEQTATSTTIKYLNKTNCESIPLALPPLAEQHRIVQKVDELMTLCDQLKERLNQASETRCQLAEAVVANAVAE